MASISSSKGLVISKELKLKILGDLQIIFPTRPYVSTFRGVPCGYLWRLDFDHKLENELKIECEQWLYLIETYYRSSTVGVKNIGPFINIAPCEIQLFHVLFSVEMVSQKKHWQDWF
jgi:hypothetical protein